MLGMSASMRTGLCKVKCSCRLLQAGAWGFMASSLLLWGCRFRGVLVHPQNLERSAAQHKVEVEGAVGQLQELRQRAEREKEALKKAARVQKEQAQRAQEYAEQLALQLAQKVPEIPPPGSCI